MERSEQAKSGHGAPTGKNEVGDTVREPFPYEPFCTQKDFFVRVDSLMSLLACRHRDFMESIGEHKEALALSDIARKIYERKVI